MSLISLTFSALIGDRPMLLSSAAALIIPTAQLVRAVRDKKHPLGGALKRGFSYPTEEAAFLHRMFKMYPFAPLADIVCVTLIFIGGIRYGHSARTQDDAMTAVYFISGGLALRFMAHSKVMRDYGRITAEWHSYVARKNGFSEKESV